VVGAGPEQSGSHVDGHPTCTPGVDVVGAGRVDDVVVVGAAGCCAGGWLLDVVAGCWWTC